MMAYNYNEIATQDPFKGPGNRKLRPLVPRPYLSPLPENTPSLTPFNFEDNTNTNKETTHQVMVSSRWNPTPEQLRALEELYRRGTRTPTAEQIQHITAQLRRYGKIEGKNVFYWFQNHKARERQKRRRQLQLPTTATTAGNRIGYEAEQKSCKWAPSTNKECDPPIQITLTEAESGGVTKAADQTSSTSDPWIHFHHHNTHHHLPPQFQHNHTINNNNNIINIPMASTGTNLLFAGERNVTWHDNLNMVQPYSSSCSCCSYPNSNSNSNSPLPSLPFPLSSKFNSSSILSQIHRSPDKPVNSNRDNVIYSGGVGSVTPPSSPSPTLQLFPVLLKSHHHDDHHDNHMEIMITKEDEERENDNASLLLLKNSCNNEKATSNKNNNNNNVNNPFPYYQFL